MYLMAQTSTTDINVLFSTLIPALLLLLEIFSFKIGEFEFSTNSMHSLSTHIFENASEGNQYIMM